MVSAARAQYLKPIRGFHSKFLAFSVNSLELMGLLPRLKSVLFISNLVCAKPAVDSKQERWR